MTYSEIETQKSIQFLSEVGSELWSSVADYFFRESFVTPDTVLEGLRGSLSREGVAAREEVWFACEVIDHRHDRIVALRHGEPSNEVDSDSLPRSGWQFERFK